MSARTPINAGQVNRFVASMFADDMHALRVVSMADATLGVIQAASLGIHAIGQGLAAAKGLRPKHAVKQVDRFLSNQGIDVWELFALWVPYIIGNRTEIVVALDWTEFDKDNQSTIAIYMVTSHGRATPLLWLTVVKSELKGWRNEHEDRLLGRLREVLPENVQVTVLADRGFGDQKLYDLLMRLEFEFVIRFRENIAVTDANGVCKPAADWVPRNGRPRLLRAAEVTRDRCVLPAVVCVKAKRMKDAWCLAASDENATGAESVNLYSRRFTIEEGFRDTKDIHFGMGLSSTRVSSPERRDRLLLLSALATVLLTLLGAAAESLGMDRMLKVNTVKKRTHSLFRQGSYWYSAIPNMRSEWLVPLMERFGQLLAHQPLFRNLFGLI